MFTVRGVTRVFPAKPAPVHALRGVDLDVQEGSLTAVLGASGCGKTTLLRILAGFDRPDEGTVHLGGRLVAGPGRFVKPEKRSVGIVAQEGALFPHLTVAQNVAYGLPGGGAVGNAVNGIVNPARRRRRAERVEEMLELVGLPGYAKRRPDELSGGQQQRIALARALAPAPSVILLDEPFSALDAALRVDLREEVRDMLRAINTTAVLVTHDQSEALSLADHVAMMRDGRVVQAGSPSDVYASPVDPEAAAFLGESVEIPCRVRGCGVDENGHIACAADELVDVDCPLGSLTVRRSAVFPCSGGDTGGTCTSHADGTAHADARPHSISAASTANAPTARTAPAPSAARPSATNPSPANTASTAEMLVLRPEQLVLSDHGGAPATVSATSFFGHDGLVRLRLHDGTPLMVRLDGKDIPAVGADVHVRVAPELTPSLFATDRVG